MAESKNGLKIGLFVLIALGCAGWLIMKFSKGPSWFTGTYPVYLKTTDVGGIRSGAGVYMAGVKVGSVESIKLNTGGRAVTMTTKILDSYTLYSNSVFSIQQAGFLGDQYVSIEPGANPGPELKPGAEVVCIPPFNMVEVARSAADLIRQFKSMSKQLNESIDRINRTVFSEESLTNLSSGVRNFRLLSDRALMTLQNIDTLVLTNSVPLSSGVSNLVVFSDDLNRLAAELQETVTTNRVEITAAIKNIESATLKIDKVLADVQAGVGVAGSLLHDKEMEAQVRATMKNLTVLSSNLATHGLLYKPPQHHPWPPAKSIYPGKNPFD